MKIVSVASEMMPFAKTGGLADVTGGLPIQIHRLGHEVLAFLPAYQWIDRAKWGFKVLIESLDVPVGNEKEKARIHYADLSKGIGVYLVDHAEFFRRDGLYGNPHGDYPDNDRRFIFFQRAVLETLDYLQFKPDIIHCNDWQSGLIPVYLKTIYADRPVFKKTKTVFTVHNLAYQGNFPPDSLPATGLSWDTYRMEKLEFYGKISFMKGGLVYADVVTTVSERYSREIQTKDYGFGMEGVLAKRNTSLIGIVNGIDFEEWNPSKDSDLVKSYSLQTIAERTQNKIALQKENDFKVDPKIPLLGIVSRLVEQKGIDILIPALEEIAQKGFQFVLLGTGAEAYHQIFREIAKRKRGQFGIHILFDAPMAKRIYSGADMMLFPSYYEPCGLGQMIALRYGAIPVVRATGGLADTIQDFTPLTGKGNGFVFKDYTREAFLEALERAGTVFRDEKTWAALIRNAMLSDFSWSASAKKFIQLYEMTIKNKTEEIKSINLRHDHSS